MFSPSARSEAQYFEDLCPWKKQFLMSTSADVPPRPMTENKKMPADFATEICRHLLLLTLY